MRPITAPMAAVIVSVVLPTFLAYAMTSGAAQPAETSGGARSDTGIEGQVIIRPVRPHETAGMPNFNPYQAMVQVLDMSEHPVTTFQSEAGGTFRVALPPGSTCCGPHHLGPIHVRLHRLWSSLPPASLTCALSTKAGFVDRPSGSPHWQLENLTLDRLTFAS